MRICFLTQYFHPDTGAAQARLYELSVRLAARGHRMTVLTAMPFYPEGRIKPGYRGRFRMTEEVNGVRIIRTWLYATQSPGVVSRMSNYLSFAATAPLLGFWGLGRQDVLLVESPPLFLVPTAWAMARLMKAKLVFNVSDLYPITAVILGAFPADHPFIRAAYWLEKVLYFHSDLVTGTSAGICRDINARYPQVPTAVIPNAVDTNLFHPDCRDPAVRREFGLQDGQVAFIYAGLHGLSQGLEQVVETARLLRDRKDIRFILAGDGPRRQGLIQLAQSLALDNITFPGVFPKKRMPGILASMDAALIPLMTDFPGAMPAKSYEALACGLPLVVASKADIAEFVAKHKVGFVVEPMDVAALVKVVQRLADDAALRRDLGIQARRVALQFDRDIVAEKVDALFTDLLRRKG